MWAFRAFSDPGFYFNFQFFRSDDLNKNPKAVSTPLPSNSAACGFGQGRIFWVFSADLCTIMCVKESELHQYKPLN